MPMPFITPFPAPGTTMPPEVKWLAADEGKPVRKRLHVQLSEADAAALATPDAAKGAPVDVTDEQTGLRFRIERNKPCGAKCGCAAFAWPL